MLWVPLPLRLSEGEAEVVPRKPCASSPPEAVAENVTEEVTVGQGRLDLEEEGQREGVSVVQDVSLLL